MGKTFVFRKALLAVSLLLAAILVSESRAREPLLTQLIRNNNWLRFSIDDGRIALRWSRMAAIEISTGGGENKESLRIHNENGQSKFNYERNSSEEQLTISVEGSGESLVISRLPRGKTPFTPVRFTQAVGEPVALTLGAGEQQQTFQAASFWRLLMAQPAECRQHLFPLMEILRPNWNLADMAASIEAELLQAARQDSEASRARWGKLVAQLGNDRFSARESADRSLRAGGGEALQYLRQLDFAQLDAEQEFRIHRIIAALAGDTEGDSAEAAAASMLRDPIIWWTLLGRADRATRETAAKQLAAILGEPLGVEPAAQPDTQKAEREQLRVKIEKKRETRK